MNCDEPIVGRAPQAKYCSDRCQQEAWRRRNPDYFSAYHTKNYQPRPKQYRTLECPYCQREFEATGKQKYCSKRCTKNFLSREGWRRRHGKQYNEVPCAVCREPFKPKDVRAVVCSQACRQLHQATTTRRKGDHKYRLVTTYWKPYGAVMPVGFRAKELSRWKNYGDRPARKPKLQVVRGGPASFLYAEQVRKNRGILLGSRPRVFQSGPCAVCGEQFASRVSNDQLRKYCSKKCEKRAHRTKLRGISWRVRQAILAKPCAYCGNESEHIDHIVPRSKGGPDAEWNLVGACFWCNVGKGTKSLWSFILEDHTRLEHFLSV